MGNLKPPLAVAVQQRGSRRSDPGRETSRVGTLPVCTEDSAVGWVDSYDDAPVVSPFVQIDVHYFAGCNFACWSCMAASQAARNSERVGYAISIESN
jgi:hypothetical protein